jgi:hypothetical protein
LVIAVKFTGSAFDALAIFETAGCLAVDASELICASIAERPTINAGLGIDGEEGFRWAFSIVALSVSCEGRPLLTDDAGLLIFASVAAGATVLAGLFRKGKEGLDRAVFIVTLSVFFQSCTFSAGDATLRICALFA